MAKTYPLIKFIRSGIVEREHFGYIVHCSKKDVIRKIGESEREKFFLRSCMKPLQAAIIKDFELDTYFGLTEEEVAIACASHVGEEKHINWVKSILDKISLTENELLCPVELPLSQKAQDELLLKNLPPQKIHSNCSGKHAIMLAACVKNNFDIKTYNEFNHPLQKYILNNIAKFAQTKKENIPQSLDGCGLPVYALTLGETALSFLNLFCSPDYESIKHAFVDYPYLIGGNGRPDSEIINAGGGRLIAKVGAGGLLAVVNIEKEEAFVVKICDATQDARTLVAIEYLKKLNWLGDKEIETSPLADLYKTKIYTATGKEIGKVLFTF